MKLSKLYCNNKKFKTIIFKEGLNIIVGTGSNLSENDSHNLGKTSIIKLIDYMLLKDITRDSDHFLTKKKEFFLDYEFFLEITYSKGKYLTIKRNVNNKRVNLKKHELRNQNFVGEDEWDFENLTLAKAKDELNKILAFSLKNDFRKFLKFILRTQKDYDFKFQKHERKDIDWKPYIMELFGFDFDKFKKIFTLRKEKEDMKESLSDFDDNYFKNLEEKKNVKDIYQNKITDLEKMVKDYNYYEIDNSVNDKLITDINEKISRLNKKKYRLSFDIENIKQSLKIKINTLDMEELAEIYKEVEIYFKDSLKKDYEALIAFNKQISKERIENLKNILVNKKKELEEVNDTLEKANEKQGEYFKILETNETVKKILLHNEELNKFKIKYAEITKELEIMKDNIEKNEELNNKIKQLDSLISEIALEIREKSNSIKECITKNFDNYTKEVFFDSEGKILIYTNKNGYPELDIKLYSISSSEITAEDNGNNYNKHMKCCFDLSVITGYIENKKRYFKFLFHDGSIEASDNKLKISYIKLVNRLCADFNIQYITTTISDEISDENVFKEIGKENIILKLTDSEDYSGTLFGERF